MTDKKELYSNTAEEAILGAILGYSDECLDSVRLAGLKVDDFYRQEHKALFHVFMKMADDNIHIDVKTAAVQIQKAGIEKDVSLMFLTGLLGRATRSDAQKSQIQLHAKTIKDYAARRGMQDLARCLLSDSQNMEKETVAISANVQERLTALTMQDDDAEWQSPTSSLCDYLDYFFRRQSGETMGLKTGFVDLDNAIIGLERGDLAILAARPSMGKTALALNIITNVCKRGGKVLFVSEETSKRKVYDRMVSSIGEIDYSMLRKGQLSKNGENLVQKICADIEKFKFDILDRRVTVAEMKARARLDKAKFGGLDLVVVDHIQLTLGNGQYRDKTHEVGEIAHELKDLAVRLEVPVLALSQLSRASETRDDKRPMLSDLRESGDLEQDADSVFGLYRPAYYERNDEEEEQQQEEQPQDAAGKQDRTTNLGILKAKDAELKDIDLLWFGECQKFVSAAIRRE